MNQPFAWITCGSFILLAAAGCGRSTMATPEPEAFPFVQCKVQLGGKEVEAATVELHGNSGDPSRKIVGRYDSEESCYRFTTNEDGQIKAGVPEGEYSVTVIPSVTSKTRIPAKYSKPATSGLSVQIKNGINFLPPIELAP